MDKEIKKVDGHFEEFSIEKLRKSLIQSGATFDEADIVLREIMNEDLPTSTRELFDRVHSDLIKLNKPHLAARYSLKRSLHLLGPTGYPFEKYIASIYSFMGYKTTTNTILQGGCVYHEMDVVARTDTDIIYIECKYHQSQSSKSNVKIPLYVKARTDDLYEFQKNVENEGSKFTYFIATNTRFTEDAQQYAYCKGIRLLSWNQPAGESLPKIIDRYGLHPVTVLTGISKKQAVRMIEQGVVQVRDILSNTNILVKSGLNKQQIDQALLEAEGILSIGEV